MQVYRNIQQYPSAEMVPGVLVVRLDAPVYFANVQWMEDKLVQYEMDALRWEQHCDIRVPDNPFEACRACFYSKHAVLLGCLSALAALGEQWQ
jgi:MFS superfamily sulfate permease-like transporter